MKSKNIILNLMKREETYLIIIIHFIYFHRNHLKEINFDKITIFYGGNGSGKTTLINMISQKLNASREVANR